MMVYVDRDEFGKILRFYKRPANDDEVDTLERLPDDDPEILIFRDRKRSLAAIDHVLRAPQFVVVLAMLKIKMADLEAEIDAAAGLTSVEQAYHKARLRRGDRYRRDDRVLMTALIACGATDTAIDEAWMKAKDLGAASG